MLQLDVRVLSSKCNDFPKGIQPNQRTTLLQENNPKRGVKIEVLARLPVVRPEFL